MDEKPVRPNDSDCCGSGCKTCIFDIYEKKLKKWELKKKDDFTYSKGLNQIHYLPFIIINIEEVTRLLKIYTFQAVVLKEELNNQVFIDNKENNVTFKILQDCLNIDSGEYLIMKGVYKSGNQNIVISRPYTPVYNKEDFNNGIFKIIVSFQDKGKMSLFFTILKINDIVFWRGPYKEFTYSSNSFKHVLLIGGGTGVVPLYNISKTIVENDEDNTMVNVLAVFKTIKSILLKDEFKVLKDYWNFKMTVYISNPENLDFQPGYNETIILKKIDSADLENEVEKYKESEVFIIVCGPDQFNKFVKSTLINSGIKEKNIFIFW